MPDRRLPHPSGKVPTPRRWSHRPGPPMTRHHRGFTAVRPPGLPLACGPRTGRGPWAFTPSFTPSVASGACRGGDRHWALARATYSSSDDPPIYEATHDVRPRGAPTCWDSTHASGRPYMSNRSFIETARHCALWMLTGGQRHYLLPTTAMTPVASGSFKAPCVQGRPACISRGNPNDAGVRRRQKWVLTPAFRVAKLTLSD